MFAEAELEYIKKRKLKRLTFDIPEETSLFQTIFGAHTIKDAMELDKFQSIYFQSEINKKVSAAKQKKFQPFECSLEMAIANEKCIEKNGFSMYQFW